MTKTIVLKMDEDVNAVVELHQAKARLEGRRITKAEAICELILSHKQHDDEDQKAK